MSLALIPSVPALPGAARQRSAAMEKAVRRGHQLAAMGLYTRARRLLEPLSEGEGKADGEVHLALGLVARAEALWEEAEQRLTTAETLSSHAGEHDSAGLALTLRVETLCAWGKLAEARQLLERIARAGAPRPGVPELCQALVQAASGRHSEARTLSTEAGALLADAPWLKGWAELTQGRALIEGAKPGANEAETFLAPRVRALDVDGRLDELVIAFRVTELHAKVQRLVQEPAASEAELPAAQQAAKSLLGLTVHLPRYAAWALALEAAIALLRGDRRAGEASFRRAVAQFEFAGCELDHGCATALMARVHFKLAQGPGRQLIARGRDLLSRAGAQLRSEQLAQLDGEGRPAAMSRSMLGASVLATSVMAGALPGEEDVELKAVFQVTDAINSVMALDELLQRILDEVKRLLKAERGVILRKLPEGLVCVAARGVNPADVRADTQEISFSVVSEVERSGEVILTDNAQTDDRFRGRASVVASEVRSVMCAPLRTQNGLLGFLYMDSTLKTRIFKESHRELLSVFATQAAIAIEKASAFQELDALNRSLEQKVEARTAELAASNVSLREAIERIQTTELKLLKAQRDALEKEMNVAREIQQSIVPPPGVHPLPGISVIGLVEPASQVGGDFWTYLPLQDGTTVVLVGDVTGHGVGSGMVTTVAKACCETLIRQHGTVEPSLLMTALSEVIYASAKGQMMMTAFACRIDPKARTLTYLSAGHNPPYLVTPGTPPAAAPLLCIAKRLGDLPPEGYDAKTCTYAPGSRLVLFTDGLVEGTNPRGMAYGDRRLHKSVLATADRPLAAQFAEVLAAYAKFVDGQPPDDDVSLVIAELS